MNILINASNLKVGGGVQVADSICRELYRFTQHNFVVVLSSAFISTIQILTAVSNVKVILYDLHSGMQIMFTGRDKMLDKLVKDEKIDAVLTIFGPSIWIPCCNHLCGFARPHIVFPNSPFFKQLSLLRRLKEEIRVAMLYYAFKKCSRFFFTENEGVSEELRKKFPTKRIYTVTNNYNQIFENPELWKYDIQLPAFNGLTMLTVSANHPHKNLSIYREVVKFLHSKYPDFKYRFVLTLNREQYPLNTDLEKEHIILLGKIDITQCPYLYKQSDVMVLPTLLECFSASYAEAMRMERPIITTDMEFAHALCSDAAIYYTPTSAEELGEAIIRMAKDSQLREKLVKAGKLQLKKFDTPEERAFKLLHIIETEFTSK